MGSNPLEMWLNFLNTCQTQGGTNAFAKSTADAWQAPAAYWQTVASIMGTRAQTTSKILENAPKHLQAIASAKSWPEYVGASMAWYGECMASAIQLDTTTQAQRAGLWNQWSHLAARNTPQQQCPTPQQTPTQTSTQTAKQPEQPKAFIPAPQPIPPRPQPMPIRVPQPAPPPPVINTLPRPSYTPISTPLTPQPANNVVAEIKPEPQQEMPLLTGTHSSTAHSVMRSSTGATVAASAAARRSVVARRSQRRRSPR